MYFVCVPILYFQYYNVLWLYLMYFKWTLCSYYVLLLGYRWCSFGTCGKQMWPGGWKGGRKGSGIHFSIYLSIHLSIPLFIPLSIILSINLLFNLWTKMSIIYKLFLKKYTYLIFDKWRKIFVKILIYHLKKPLYKILTLLNLQNIHMFYLILKNIY